MTLSGPEQHFVDAIYRTRYGVAAALLAVLWTAESLAPMFPGRKRKFSHDAANLTLAAINALVSFCFVFLILAVTEYSRTHHLGLLHWIGGPTGFRWPVALAAFDCWQYWWHRINHRVPFLWRFHSVHHADAEMDATSAVRFHTGEIILSFAARLAVLPVLGMTLPQLALYETISLPIILFHHSNVRLPGRIDQGLRWLIVTPWMHVVHHSRYQPDTDSNYSSLLSVWDRVFRSFRLRDKPAEISLGLERWEDWEWRGLIGLLQAPFAKNGRRRDRNIAPKV
jgi:sterol desaturase/sphingolipid hydroxylase (fatty acid hydroxylase superfamily)